MAANSIGTVRPQRIASRIEPMCTDFHCVVTDASVKVICTTTSVMGSGIAATASLLKTDMPALHSM